MDNCKLLNDVAVARILRIPRDWLRAESDACRIPCLRAGEFYLYDLDAVEAVLLERARQQPGEVPDAR